MHVYVLFHGEYDERDVVAASLNREPLDAWVAEYEAATSTRRQPAWVQVFDMGALPPVADYTPGWAKEPIEDYRARIAAERAASPHAWLSTGSVGFIADVVI